MRYRWSKDFPDRQYFRVRCFECGDSLVSSANCSFYAFEPFRHSCGTLVYGVGNTLVRTGRRTIYKASETRVAA